MKPEKTKVTSFRLDPHLQHPIQQWLKKNPQFTQSTLINFALEKLISENQTLESVDVELINDKAFERSAKKMMEKHSDMLDKLK